MQHVRTDTGMCTHAIWILSSCTQSKHARTVQASNGSRNHTLTLARNEPMHAYKYKCRPHAVKIFYVSVEPLHTVQHYSTRGTYTELLSHPGVHTQTYYLTPGYIHRPSSSARVAAAPDSGIVASAAAKGTALAQNEPVAFIWIRVRMLG